MASIRLPASAEPLLQFCRTSGSDSSHIWETYADMVAFLAAYAFKHDQIPGATPTPLKGINPIDLGTFRSRGLYSLLLTLVIAEQRNWYIAKDPELIARTVERLSSAGAMLLSSDGNATSGTAVACRILGEFRPEAAHSSVEI